MEKTRFTEGPLAPLFEKLGTWGAGPNPLVDTPDADGRIAGFWLGLWHGATAPITFVLSAFSKNVHVFEVHNNGKGYLIGFLIGLTALWGGGGGAGAARQRKPGG